MKKRAIYSILCGSVPLVLMGYSTGPPPKRTGAAVDGGLNCTACHRTFAPANSDVRGSVRIDAASYVPGVTQTIKVTVSHPEAARWGFEITARLASDGTQTAGHFAPNDVARVICDDGSARGALAPCASGQLEFAEHFDAPRTAPGTGFTFSVDWTPPATDVGDIVFYAAGNAADGNSAPTNDRIYTTTRRISAPCKLAQKPVITGAVNGASFGAAWNSGSMMSLFGSNFAAAGATRLVTGGDIVSSQFPQSLGCIAVSINGQNAPLAYVQGNQINLQVPLLGTIGPANVIVIANPGASNEIRSDPFTVSTQQAFSPAFFTFNGKSVAATSSDGKTIIAAASTVPGGSAAKPGDIVVLYATGLGQTTPAYSPGDIPAAAAKITGAVTVNVGGVTVPDADVLYAGVSPQSICGLQQINVRLPSTLPDGDVPVAISVAGAASPPGTTIPIKN